MNRQPVIYLCRYRTAAGAGELEHAVALERGPRSEDDYDALPDVLAELLSGGLGIDRDAVTVLSAERVDVSGGGVRRVEYVAPAVA